MSDVTEAMAKAEAESREIFMAIYEAWEEAPANYRASCIEEVKTALRAAEKAGWRLVPVEPTEEMELKVNAACDTPDADLGWTYVEWLQAAPRPWSEDD